MTHATAGEKGAGPLCGAVYELIDQNKMSWLHLVAKRTAGTDRDDICHSKPFQSVDIGAIGHIAGGMDMAAPVTGQEDHFDTGQLSGQQLIGRHAPGTLDLLPFGVLQPINVINPGATNHSNFCCAHRLRP